MQAVVAANHAQAIIIPRLEEYENIFGGTCYKIYTRTHTRVEVKVKSLAMTMTMRTTRMTMVENAVVGAPCAVMDQMASACGEANKLLAMVCQRFILDACQDTTLIILMVAVATSLVLGIKTEEVFMVFKKSMMTDSDMTDLGTMRYFLSIEVKKRTNCIFIGQCKYAQEMLEKINMDQCNSVHNTVDPGLKLIKDEEGTEVDGTIYRQMEDRPLFVQFCSNDLDTLHKAAKRVEAYCDYVDINL
nr:uncharacterized mitochondrial protein AtMg00810-like [Tanacetum cinerariifolium]